MLTGAFSFFGLAVIASIFVLTWDLSLRGFRADGLTESRFHKRPFVALSIWLVASALCFVPIVEGFCFIEILESFFDPASYFSCLLVCLAALARGLESFQSKSAKKWGGYLRGFRLDATSALILFIYGALVYGGALGFIEVDIYRAGPLAQCAFIFIAVLLLYFSSKAIGVIALLALAIEASHENLVENIGVDSRGMIEALIDPYLWAYCGIYLCLLCIRLGIKGLTRG